MRREKLIEIPEPDSARRHGSLLFHDTHRAQNIAQAPEREHRLIKQVFIPDSPQIAPYTVRKPQILFPPPELRVIGFLLPMIMLLETEAQDKRGFPVLLLNAGQP